MSISANLEELLNREVTRRQFVIGLGALVVAVLGINRLGKLFDFGPKPDGFGSGPYGGRKKG